mgnify:CR=1 FL=1|jgi:large subunit ribosomal protein L32e
MTDKKRLLEQRKDLKSKKPNFVRQDSHKKPKLGNKWRRPKGIQSKMRLHKRGYRRSISKGWKSPKEVRGLDRDGFMPVIIHALNQLINIDKETQSIIIASDVGQKKKVDLVKEALKLNLSITNFDAEKYLNKVEEELKKKKQAKEVKDKKKEDKKKEEAKEDKKDTIEEALTEEETKQQDKKDKDKMLIKRTA